MTTHLRSGIVVESSEAIAVDSDRGTIEQRTKTTVELPGLSHHYTEGENGSVWSPRVGRYPARIGLLYLTKTGHKDVRARIAEGSVQRRARWSGDSYRKGVCHARNPVGREWLCGVPKRHKGNC